MFSGEKTRHTTCQSSKNGHGLIFSCSAAFPVLVLLQNIHKKYLNIFPSEVENAAMFSSILVHVNVTSSNTPSPLQVLHPQS